MISTVTISTITTISTIAALGLTATVSIVAAVALIVFLSGRELASARGGSTSMRVGRYLSVGIIPLLMAFAAFVGVKIVEVLA
jgi:hypothetical protein